MTTINDATGHERSANSVAPGDENMSTDASDSSLAPTSKISFPGRRQPSPLKPIDVPSTGKDTVSTYPETNDSFVRTPEHAMSTYQPSDDPFADPVSTYPDDIFNGQRNV
jgi:hypothetical protein